MKISYIAFRYRPLLKVYPYFEVFSHKFEGSHVKVLPKLKHFEGIEYSFQSNWSYFKVSGSQRIHTILAEYMSPSFGVAPLIAHIVILRVSITTSKRFDYCLVYWENSHHENVSILIKYPI